MKIPLRLLLSFATLLAFFTNNSLYSAKPFIFPLPIKPRLSGSFGEFRYSIMHMGLDIKTYGVNNLPVKATRRGSLHRLLGGPEGTASGFGQALYLKHDNNYVSTYGHLSKLSQSHHFEAAWQLYKRMSPSGYFSIYFPQNLFKVNQNETIAFSGERGHGVSHLHFEIADQTGAYIDPASAIRFSDSMAPKLTRVLVNNFRKAVKGHKSCSLYKTNQKQWILAQRRSRYNSTSNVYLCRRTLVVSGKTAFKISTYDNANALNKLGIYSINLYVDGKHYIKIKVDRYWRKERYLTSVLFDRYRSGLSPVRYTYKVYSGAPGNSKHASWVKQNNNGGWLNTESWKTNSIHSVDIAVRDFKGNLSVAKFKVRKKNGKDLKVKTSKPKHYSFGIGQSIYYRHHSLKVTSLPLSSPANFKVSPKSYRTKWFLKKISSVYTIKFKKRWGSRDKLSYQFKSKFHKSYGVYTRSGRRLSSKYDWHKKAYLGTLTGSANIFLAKDKSRPTTSMYFHNGPLEQDKIRISAYDTGSGIDIKQTKIFIDGQMLSISEKINLSIHYDEERKVIVIPTATHPHAYKTSRRTSRPLWVIPYDKAGNAGSLWQGVIQI